MNISILKVLRRNFYQDYVIKRINTVNHKFVVFYRPNLEAKRFLCHTLEDCEEYIRREVREDIIKWLLEYSPTRNIRVDKDGKPIIKRTRITNFLTLIRAWITI